jgi:hypothetical protein
MVLIAEPKPTFQSINFVALTTRTLRYLRNNHGVNQATSFVFSQILPKVIMTHVSHWVPGA